jgi:hypothetical protein
MATLWERIQALEGQTLVTVSGRATFDVASVDDGYVRVVPRKTGKTRPIPHREFELAASLGLLTAEVTPIQLRREGVSEFNPAYVAAIIRAVMRQWPE